MQECKNQGCRVFVLTRHSLQDDPGWERQHVDEFFYMPTLTKKDDVIKAVSYLARTERIDRIVPMDDFDVDVAASLREHLRAPGMGDTTARYFRDKLAMRLATEENGIRCPAFSQILNYDRLREYMEKMPPPWLLKPRSQAGSAGIKKFWNSEDLWRKLDELGDEQSFYLLESFVPGDIFHVDAITSEGKVLFVEASKYGRPPLEVTQQGGIFMTRTLSRTSDDAIELFRLNEKVLKTLNFRSGVTHTEFIKSHADGEFYFLETAARVGGAYISDVIDVATGINLWAEWAKLEIAAGQHPYKLPACREGYAGIVLCLANQPEPDTSSYNDPEIVTRIKKEYHAGLIFSSPDAGRVDSLMWKYAERFSQEFLASAPQYEKIER